MRYCGWWWERKMGFAGGVCVAARSIVHRLVMGGQNNSAVESDVDCVGVECGGATVIAEEADGEE